ncbi:hypothetical protein DL98DRAFT_599291 [Cadophora sp. DSE1049]|nr:hypothetical protein DL98DRAFT_599291 [Cadophora sp. DSE1049]
MSYPARPQSQPLYHLPPDRSAVDGHELGKIWYLHQVIGRATLKIYPELVTFNNYYHLYVEQDNGDYDNDSEGGKQPQQEVKEDVAAALMAGKIGGTHLFSKKDESLGLAYHDPSPEPSHDKLRGHSDSYSDDELSNTPKSEEDIGDQLVWTHL